MPTFIQNRINQSFEKSGYQMILFQMPELVLFRKETAEEVLTVLVYTITEQPPIASEYYRTSIIEDIYGQLSSKSTKPVRLLSLISSEHLEQAKEYMGETFPTWILAEDIAQLVIYENQPQDFDGLKEIFERIFDPEFRVKKLRPEFQIKKFPFITTALVFANILIYFIGIFGDGGMLYRNMVREGSLSWQRVIDNKEYYRLITCMFLHGDLSHLFHNMLVLFVMGGYIEKMLGKWRYIILYFGAGILAGGFSLGYNMYMATEVYSIGASGAIMGVVGAFIFILLKNRGRVEGMSLRQIVFFAFFSIYGGITTAGVDNMAHIGGLLSGFALAIILYRRKKRW